MEADRDYFLHRAQQERNAAETSLNAEARCAHLELSAQYDAKANALLLQNTSKWKRFWR